MWVWLRMHRNLEQENICDGFVQFSSSGKLCHRWFPASHNVCGNRGEVYIMLRVSPYISFELVQISVVLLFFSNLKNYVLEHITTCFSLRNYRYLRQD